MPIIKVPESNYAPELDRIAKLDKALSRRMKQKFTVEPLLTRSLVSFQANKTRPVYRWYKFKEAFSSALVEHLLHVYEVNHGAILDPFAGSGTALFSASALCLDADGIELLPIGQQIITTKTLLDSEFTPNDFEELHRWANSPIWENSNTEVLIPELRITKDAYSVQTKKSIEKYLATLQEMPAHMQAVLRFALLCVVEAVSYTRKDGQYLRWDYRSGRRQGKKRFDKGYIPEFNEAVSAKIGEILADLTIPARQPNMFDIKTTQGTIRLFDGSCLDVMPTLPNDNYNAIITSPPYCNRYDYTRTYALELALLGVNEKELVQLRQEMLSCTVENRSKNLLAMNPNWKEAIAIADNQELLQAILEYLEQRKADKTLNNTGIPRMVRGYFYEMACIIAECSRVLKPNAPLFMINDNVRYAGASISVDTILSDFAENLGFYVESILVLPKGKGNSSQQMGEHGREPLRKCVYIWRKQ